MGPQFFGDWILGGGLRAKLIEPRSVTVCRDYGVQWKRQEIDLPELRRLRKKMTLSGLAEHFQVGTTTVKMRLREVRIRL
jgi:hypothetical protein